MGRHHGARLLAGRNRVGAGMDDLPSLGDKAARAITPLAVAFGLPQTVGRAVARRASAAARITGFER